MASMRRTPGKQGSQGGNGLKPWGIALERLRENRLLSKSELCHLAWLDRSEYNAICRKQSKGPSIDTMERLLLALRCTWMEWGAVYEAVKHEAGRSAKQPSASELAPQQRQSAS